MKYVLIIFIAALFMSCEVMGNDTVILSDSIVAQLEKVFPIVDRMVYIDNNRSKSHYDMVSGHIAVRSQDINNLCIMAHEMAHRWQFRQLGRVAIEYGNYYLPSGELEGLSIEQEAQVIAILCGLRNGIAVYTEGVSYTMADYDRLNRYAQKYMKIF